jgi:hypothetical protein
VCRGSEARGLVTSGPGRRGSATVRATAAWDTFVSAFVGIAAVVGMVVILPVWVVREEGTVDTVAGVLWGTVWWWAAVRSDWVRLEGRGWARPEARGSTRSRCSCDCTGS